MVVFIAINIPGGTIDIIVHEVGENGALAEIYPACGGNWGGTLVDQAFLDFLTNLSGEHALEELRSTDITDLQGLMRDFENKKRNAGRQHENSKISIQIPTTLQEPVRNKLETKVFGFTSDDRVELKRDKLIFSSPKMLEFFILSEESFEKYLRILFAEKLSENVKTIIMVGGFSIFGITEVSRREV